MVMLMEKLQKVFRTLHSEGIDFALLSSHENVMYASNFDTPVPLGAANDFAGSLPLSLVLVNAKEDIAYLITADVFSKLAAKQSNISNKLSFPIFGHFEQVDPAQSYLDCICKLLHDVELPNKHIRLGIEFKTLPSLLLDLLLKEFKEVQIVDVEPSLEKVKRVKTDREIECLRRAARVADAGQMAFLNASKAEGGTEFEIWAEVQRVTSQEAGMPVPISGEIVTGARTNVVAPGGPQPRVIVKGDCGIMDLSVRVDGYWCDCCNFVVFGKHPDNEQIRYFTTVKEAFDVATEMLRPGVRSCDMFTAMQ